MKVKVGICYCQKSNKEAWEAFAKNLQVLTDLEVELIIFQNEQDQLLKIKTENFDLVFVSFPVFVYELYTKKDFLPVARLKGEVENSFLLVSKKPGKELKGLEFVRVGVLDHPASAGLLIPVKLYTNLDLLKLWLIRMPTYREILEALKKGEIDAGVVSKEVLEEEKEEFPVIKPFAIQKVHYFMLPRKGEIIVKLKENVTVNGTAIKIKDIGMVIGDSRLENIILAQFSPQSDSFLINKQLVLNEISNFYRKINENVPVIKVFSKDVVKIKRRSFFITNKTISSLIGDFLKTNEKKIFKRKKWRIIKIIAQNKIKLPSNDIDIKISLINEKNFFRLPFIVEFLNKKHNKIRSVRAYAIVEVKETVVVATKNIFMRKAILPNMVELKEIAIKNNNSNFYKSINNVVGKITKRYIRAGEPISTEIIQSPPMVKRGEIVNVIAVSNGISINTKGKVLENGFYDKSVKVLNLSSGKVFSAVVKGYGEVIVNF